MDSPISASDKRSASPFHRLLPALLLVLLITGTAPMIDRLRAWFFDAFPRSAVPVLGYGFAALAVLLFLVAVWRIRHHRWLRYGGLAVVAALLWLQTVGFSRGIARVDVVEKVHILEYGLLACLLYWAWKPSSAAALLLPLLGVAFAGLLDEGVQWWAPQRVGEIRDVALNVFAGFCGLLFSLCLHPPPTLALRASGREATRVLRGAALVVLAGGFFFSLAHLGYEIEDEEIGSFRSWFKASTLHRLAAKRAQTWARHPPTGQEVWSREDYFLTEAGLHASHRNSALRAGNILHAWKANRILEVYYTPFLDIEGFHGTGKHRLPTARRNALAAEVGSQRDVRYASPVLAERIYVWPPKPAFWSAVLSTAAVLWLLPRLLGWTSRRT